MFIAHADFSFPIEAYYYFTKHFYLWSFQNGAVNPDGIIRLLMRLPVIGIAYLFDGLAASYFYIFFTLAICFAAFYFFLEILLKIKRVEIKLLCAFLFVFNPIFLGNFAKLGLVQAVGMLPLSLIFIFKGFATKNFWWFLPWILTINAAFVHPFTLIITLLSNGIFFGYLMIRNKQFVYRSKWQFLLIGLATLVLNAYFLLPLMGLGSLDKKVLSAELADEEPDYSQLINVAANKDLVESFSLTKSVFLDFNFFNQQYAFIYHLSILFFYLGLIFTFLYKRAAFSKKERRLITIFLLTLLALLMASTTSISIVSSVLLKLITLPGGWMFRSPLKWQLYIPLFLFSLLALALKHIKSKFLPLLLAFFYMLFVFINGYVFSDVMFKLLKPRQIHYLTDFSQINLELHNLAYVYDTDCYQTTNDNPTFFSELSIIFNSNTVQVKRMSMSDAKNYILDNFDYLMTCQVAESDLPLAIQKQFELKNTYLAGAVRLYHNNEPLDLHSTTASLYAIDDAYALDKKSQFTHNQLQNKFNFVLSKTMPEDLPIIRMHELFNKISAERVFSGYLEDDWFVLENPALDFYFETDNLEAIMEKNTIQFIHNDGQQSRHFSTTMDKYMPLTFRYFDSQIQTTNIVPNGSFESGSWEKEVRDCYNYDTLPVIAMGLNEHVRVDGSQSLELKALRHVACTQTTLPIEPNSPYVFSLSFKGEVSKFAQYYLAFNDAEESGLGEKISLPDTQWRSHSKTFVSPAEATEMTITLYGVPTGSDIPSLIHYDAVSLFKIPPIQNTIFAINPSGQQLSQPKGIATDYINPTKSMISITGAQQPFYLISKDSYHAQWQLLARNRTPLDVPHFMVNNYQNGWFIDPEKICPVTDFCAQNPDGSYDMRLILEFAPQRLFYIGLITSMLGLLISLVWGLWVWGKSKGKVTGVINYEKN